MSTITEAENIDPIPVEPNSGDARDFCNAFWGTENRGPKTLFGRMKLAQATVKEFHQFCNERSLIEANYAAHLATLSNRSLGRNETGALRDSLEALRRETEKQAIHHTRLSSLIFIRCRTLLPRLDAKYAELRVGLQEEVEKNFKEKEALETEVTVAREKYDAGCARVFSLIERASAAQSTEEQEQVRVELYQARDSAQASQTNLADCTQRLHNFLSQWEALWKNFCDKCQDLEEARLDMVKGVLWDNMRDFSAAGVDDCDSWERISLSLKQLTPEEDVKVFVDICRTGNSIPEPPTFTPHNLDASSTSNVEPPSYMPPTPATRQATFNRISRPFIVPPMTQPTLESPLHEETLTDEIHWESISWDHESASPPEYSNNNSGPTKILFYVKARQEYTAMTSDHLSFRKGDVIGVTSVGDDIRWRGDHVDETRKEEGRHFFPRTYVSMVQNAAGETLRPKLFYVKARFDYTARRASELSFKKDDVLAITSIGEEGWWRGEHYDDTQREKGRFLISYTSVVPAYNVGTNVDV